MASQRRIHGEARRIEHIMRRLDRATIGPSLNGRELPFVKQSRFIAAGETQNNGGVRTVVLW